MIFDYETLRVIWWGLLGLLMIGFTVTGGFDLGVAMLLPFLAKSDDERRIVIQTIEPGWAGNQVWFILVVAALFSAWPTVYAVFLSSFYFVLLFALVALFLRPLGFAYRSKLPYKKWRNNWDKALFIGGTVPAFIFGVAIGNLFTGIPFHFETDMRIIYLGGVGSLINPFSIVVGLLSLSLFVMHGAVYLQIKTEGNIKRLAKIISLRSTLVSLFLFALTGLWLVYLDGYHIVTEVFLDNPSNPLDKTVKREPGLWLDNYGHFPDLWIIPAFAFLSGYVSLLFSRVNRPGSAFIFSAFMIVAIILTASCTLFPFMIPSNISLNSSLTVWDSSASLKTLNVMFWVSIIFLPLIVLYTSWVFNLLRGKITLQTIQKYKHTVY